MLFRDWYQCSLGAPP